MNQKGSIIVIDDEESVLEILDNYFTSRNFKVHKAKSGNESEEVLAEKKCDVALIDLKLPDCSGLDLISMFNSKYPEMKCVIMTAFASVDTTISALRHNVFDYIQKPFDLVKIGEIVEAAYTQNIETMENTTVIEKLVKANRMLEENQKKLNRKVVEANKKLASVNKSLKIHVTRLKMLFQMGRDISSNENWDDALDRFLMALCKYLEAGGAGILLFSKGGKELNTRTSYTLENEFLEEAVRMLQRSQERDLLQPEIFCLEGCDERIVTCLASEKPWEHTVITLLFKGKWLGFLILRKSYKSRMSYLRDYHFINTIQTIFTEEVANAVNISRLRNLKNFNETILENINSGVLKTDKDGRIIFLNSKAKEIIGESHNGNIHFDEIFDSGEVEGSLFKHLTESREGISSFESAVGLNRKIPIPVKVSSKTVETDEYSGKTIVSVFEDLSEQKALEKELRRADRLRSLGELSAGVAHEIRNPLTGIATTAQVLREKLKGEDETAKYISVILNEINRLDGIIKNLLDFARPAAPKLSEISVHGLIKDCVDLMRKNADKNGVIISIENLVDDDICLIDRDQIKQVVINLSKNAIQACENGGELKIKLKDSPEPGTLAIEFRDTGKGIEEQVSEKLYDPFFTTKKEGSGLGLSISRKIIEGHRGSISHSLNSDGGTTFFIGLPKNKIDATDNSEEASIMQRGGV